MNRRDFLQLLGLGAAAVAAPAVLLPERRIWQVSRNAPVGSRIERAYVGMDPGVAERTALFVGEYGVSGGWHVREVPREQEQAVLLLGVRSAAKAEAILRELREAAGLGGVVLLPKGTDVRWVRS